MDTHVKETNQRGVIADFFQYMVNCAHESSGTTAKSLCSKLLIGTVKRDVSSVEASYELSGLASYRSSHTFQSVSLTGFRALYLSKPKSTVTMNTILDKYMNRIKSLYSFICRQGNVPVIISSLTASFPLEEEYCRITLLMHWPNWRTIEDIRTDDVLWTSTMEDFLQSKECPNFIRAEIERTKQHHTDKNMNDDANEDDPYNLVVIDEPEWMESIRPNAQYENRPSNFQYDDGGPDVDWTNRSYDYRQNHLSFIEKIHAKFEDSSHVLDIPTIDVESLNQEQLMAYNIALKTLHLFISNNEDFEPLRMVIIGTVGSVKSYLIKCIVKAVRTIFQTNMSVQVLCPTGNSANLISGITIHSFLKIPINTRTKEMAPPDGAIGETFQENLKDLKVLLIDERSFIGTTNTGWMECRCGMVGSANFCKSCGGIPVVVYFSDDVQLPPVLDSPVYNCSSKTPDAIYGVLVWREFNQVVGLRTVVRQGHDEKLFKRLLSELKQ